jgi:hypothetical protein
MMLRMPLPASIAGCRGVGVGRRRRQMPRSPADGILGQPDVHVLNDTATIARGTSAWDQHENRIVGVNQRRRKPVTIGSKTYFADLSEIARTNLLAAGTSPWGGSTAGTPGTAPTGWTDFDSGGSLASSASAVPGEYALAFTVSGAFRRFISQTISVSASTRYIMSCVCRSNATGYRIDNLISWGSEPAGATKNNYFINGALVAASTVPAAGDRISLELIVAGTPGTASARFGNGTGSNSLEQPQVEAGYFATTYISNRNLLSYSEEINDASWSKTRSSINPNSVANPIDGALTADTVIDTVDVNTQHYFSKAVSKAASSLTYTFSAYGRRKERDFVLRVTDSGFTNGCRAFFNLSTGALLSSDAFGAGFAIVGTPSATSVIAPDGSQWYRCSITVTSDASAFIRAAIELIEAGIADDTYTGDGTSGGYVYGLQLQYGTVATDYWAVQGTVGQRGNENLVATDTTATAGTWYVVLEPHGFTGDQDGSTNWNVLRANDATGPSRIARTSATLMTLFRDDAGGTQSTTITPGVVSGVRSKIAMSWDAVSVRAHLNGVPAGTPDTTLTAPYTEPTTVTIGSAGGTAQHACSYILAIVKAGIAWTDTELALISSETRASG